MAAGHTSWFLLFFIFEVIFPADAFYIKSKKSFKCMEMSTSGANGVVGRPCNASLTNQNFELDSNEQLVTRIGSTMYALVVEPAGVFGSTPLHPNPPRKERWSQSGDQWVNEGKGRLCMYYKDKDAGKGLKVNNCNLADAVMYERFTSE